jgi:hypothetical protein
MDPAVGYPVRSGMRRTVVATGNPYIARAIPAMITRNPFISRAGAWPRMLDHCNGRSDTHNNLRVGGSGQQAHSEQSRKNKFLHRYILLYLWRLTIYYWLFERRIEKLVALKFSQA